MNLAEIQLLQGMRKHPSVSLLLSTLGKYPGSQEDQVRLERLVHQATERLKKEYAATESAAILERLRSVMRDIDYRHLPRGLAIFVNEDFARICRLPFPLKERVAIDDRFAIRELVLGLNRTLRFWVLVLTEARIRLLWGCDGTLVEARLSHFPLEHVIQDGPVQAVTSGATFGSGSWYPGGHAGPSGHAPLPGDHAPDVSHSRDEHLREFFREADRSLSAALVEDPASIVLAGTQRHIALFKEVSENAQRIIGYVAGSYDKTWSWELAERCLPIVASEAERHAQVALRELSDSVSANRHASGIREVWQMARSGRCKTLLVERNYFCSGKVQAAGEQVEPVELGSGPDVVEDVVDNLVEQVLSDRGKVVFVEDGQLNDYERVAAVLRY